MQTNSNKANGGQLYGVNGASCSSGDSKQAHDNFIVQYIKDYQSIRVNCIAPHVRLLNAPDYMNAQCRLSVVKLVFPAIFWPALKPQNSSSLYGQHYIALT